MFAHLHTWVRTVRILRKINVTAVVNLPSPGIADGTEPGTP